MTAMPYVHDKPEADKLANAKEQGQAQFDSIREMVEALQEAEKARNDAEDAPEGDTDGEAYNAYEDAERAIHEDALSVEVRSGWHTYGEDGPPEEYRILLCTGGPAVQIVGELSEHGEPETAVMQVQDWFQPWTAIIPSVDGEPDVVKSREIMLAYARCFYFGE